MQSRIFTSKIALLYLFSLILLLPLFSEASSNTTLFFNEKTHQFKILQFTDLHYGETTLKDLLNIALESFLIHKGKPDLVAFSGDMVSGWEWDNTTTFYQRLWTKYTFPLIESQTQYALTMGNHDAQANLNGRQIVEHDMSSPFSQTKMSPENVNGATNYWLPVYSQFNKSKPAAVIWFLDTHMNNCMGDAGSYGCVDQTQIDWFESEQNKLVASYGQFMSLVFIHIPLPQTRELVNTQPIYGLLGGKGYIGCPQVDSGFFNSLKKYKVRAVFYGHDHDNDFGGFLDGVELIYGRKTGFGCYGPRNEKNEFMERGARSIHLTEKQDPETGEITVEFHQKILLADGIEREVGPSFKRIEKVNSCYPFVGMFGISTDDYEQI